MKRVLVLTTGGTIVSLRSKEGLKPGDDLSQMLFNKIISLAGEYDVTFEPIFNKDSSNIIPSDWYIVKETIRKHIDKYDGIVILHGTDTMSYSAAMLSYMFCNVEKAIVLTGSQIPIAFDNSDGVKNLKDAIITAADGRLSGVFVVFHDKIMKGTRVYKRSSINKDAYISCNYPYVGVIKERKLYITDDYKRMQEKEVDIKEILGANDICLNNQSTSAVAGKTLKIPKIFMLKMVPGFEPGLLDYILKEGYQGVIIEGYGLGGMPVANMQLLENMERLIKRGIPVIMATQCVYDGVNLDTYEVGVTAGRLGILSAYDMTTEAVYTKLMWILGITDSYPEIKKFLQTNICGEIAVKHTNNDEI
ncbi:L-asparaginase 1 [Anaerocolumna cellulosilytica]|uniref:L-asparaginase 1 n=1 Tax=Anaerocolumna cellulosilytica TaxID=433286 RepID=A0A6S6R7S4_9FIRM|nr:asparaginase [Anaerocolumna cellulosilytica]MBB5193772.1 L-asparaginase [Anaerocolumna cellulosilytica]BCJ95011.1 L-asparaginase 1 [Anaerocolumna cellulosilytica]